MATRRDCQALHQRRCVKISLRKIFSVVCKFSVHKIPMLSHRPLWQGAHADRWKRYAYFVSRVMFYLKKFSK